MVLNYIWVSFFLVSFIIALIRLFFFGDLDIFQSLVTSTFDNAKTGFEISLFLTGVLSLWLGIMKIGERAGIISVFSRLISPLFVKLFPGLPKNDKAYGSIVMNIAANMLGLDNAATPMGLKAMEQMQEVNDKKDTASNAQIMFLVLNTSGLTLIPVSIMVYRAQLGAANPADIFIPILLATYVSTMVGLLAVAIKQRINIFDRTIMLYLGGVSLLVGAMVYYFSGMEQSKIAVVSGLMSNIILFSIIIGFIILGVYRKINLYDAFIDGAKEGFSIAIKIIPYLIAILVGVGLFRVSGAMDYFTGAIAYVIGFFGVNTEFVNALPTALMKPLSGGGARGMMIDTMKTYGVDSFAGRLSCVFQGACDTTFYIVAVYFGAVGIKNTRYAISFGLLADFAGVVAAIFIAYYFFY
ncbi:MAG: hypothetical protein IPO21_03230 [Bacteroidales bacterium]|nr:hypothetical protein [Bacteroidales bacterium]